MSTLKWSRLPEESIEELAERYQGRKDKQFVTHNQMYDMLKAGAKKHTAHPQTGNGHIVREVIWREITFVHICDRSDTCYRDNKPLFDSLE